MAVFVTLFGAATAAASPVELFGFGGRSSGLAGTGVASADDYESVYANPAGLADARTKKLTVGFLASRFTLRLNGNKTDTPNVRGLSMGAAVPLRLGGAMADRLTLGFGLISPRRAVARAYAALPGQATFALLESRAEIITINAGLGFRLSDRWRVGASAIILSGLTGNIHVDVDSAGQFEAVAEERMPTQLAPIVGAGFTARDDLRFGLVLRGASQINYDIVVTNTVGDSLPLALPTFRIAGTAQYDPLTASAEAAWNPIPALALTGNVSYQRWSAYPLPAQNPILSGEAPPAPGFRDTVTPRAAAEWTLASGSTQTEVRAGYAFIMTPAPHMNGPQSLLDSNRHLISTGLGLSWPKSSMPLSLDLWFQLHALMPRTHTKNPALFAPEMEIGDAVLKTRGRVLVGGLAVGVDL